MLDNFIVLYIGFLMITAVYYFFLQREMAKLKAEIRHLLMLFDTLRKIVKVYNDETALLIKLKRRLRKELKGEKDALEHKN